MASDPTTATVARRKHVPGTRVFNWQSTENQGARHLLRRPMTACEACRAAKIKCNGKRQCERCKRRRLSCTYTTISKDSASVETSSATSTTSQTTDHSYANLSNGTDSFTIGNLRDMGMPEDSFNNTLEHDWFFEDGMNLDDPILALDDMNFFQSPPKEEKSSNEDGSQRPITLSDPIEFLMQDPTFTSSVCPCRTMLMLHIPSLECVMRETPKPPLDKMFKVTREIISSCHSVMNCVKCRIGPVDLVCILTVFQQTATCFNYIVKSGIDGNIKVSIGDYEMHLNDDPAFKGMLVLNLVKEANSMLDSLSTRAHDMFSSQDPTKHKVTNLSPVCLNQLNLDYLAQVIAKFRKSFRLMASIFGDRESDKE